MRFWFNEPKRELHRAITATARAIVGCQSGRRANYKRWENFYLHGSHKSHGLAAPEESLDSRSFDLALEEFEPYTTWNLVRAAINALVAKVTVDSPVPEFQTTDAPEDLQHRARKLRQFTEANLRSSRAFREARRAARMACIYGTGLLKVFAKDGRVQVRCIHPRNIIVDDESARDGRTLTMIHREKVSRHKLTGQFRDVEAVRDAERADHDSAEPGFAFRDNVYVWEAWHLPSGNKPGRHALVTTAGVLHDEVWKKRNHPFSIIRFGEDVEGWHGMSLIRDLEGVQHEINGTLEKIGGNMEIMANSFVFVNNRAQIKEGDIGDNSPYKIIEGAVPPQIITPPAVHPQVFDYLERQWRRGFELIGLDTLQATGSNPALPRLESGRAVRSAHNIQSERFSELIEQYGQLIVDVGNLMLQVGRDDIAGKGQKWAAKGLARRFLTNIDWKDIGLDEHEYHMSIAPASALSRSPAGKLAELQELAQGGLLERDEIMPLLAEVIPDLAKFMRLKTAAHEDLEWTFERILIDGEDLRPLPFQKIDVEGLQLATSYIFRGMREGLEQDRIDSLHRWVQEATDIIAQQQQLVPPESGGISGDLAADPRAAQMLAQAGTTGGGQVAPVPGNGAPPLPGGLV